MTSKTKDPRVIKQFDDNNMIAHITLGFPMINDRDLVVKADTEYDLSKARGIVKLSLVRDSAAPVGTGVVRMPCAPIRYTLRVIADESAPKAHIVSLTKYTLWQ